MQFSIIGLILVVFILLPSIVFSIKYSPVSIPKNIDNSPKIYGVMEKFGQIGCIASLIVYSINNIDLGSMYYNIFWSLVILSYIIYYYCWIRYVKKGREYIWLGKSFLFIPIPLAVLPSCIFILLSIISNSVILALFGIVFSVAHIKISYDNYIQAKKEFN